MKNKVDIKTTERRRQEGKGGGRKQATPTLLFAPVVLYSDSSSLTRLLLCLLALFSTPTLLLSRAFSFLSFNFFFLLLSLPLPPRSLFFFQFFLAFQGPGLYQGCPSADFGLQQGVCRGPDVSDRARGKGQSPVACFPCAAVLIAVFSPLQAQSFLRELASRS